MSEGIIQRVGYAHKSLLDRNCKQFTYRDVIMHFELYEQALIAEIKKYGNISRDDWISMKLLLGTESEVVGK